MSRCEEPCQVISYFETNNLFCKFQFGYRHKRSCELAVTHFVDSIRKDIDSGKYVGAVYIDLAKAFDTVSHSVILNKLQSYGIIENELTWFTDYLFQRKQYVKFDGSKSESDFVTCGVPQGSILGPLLFLIHFNDIENCLKNSRLMIYADDTVIFTASKDVSSIENSLNEDLINLQSWLSKNELLINLKKGKTESMLFGSGKRLSKLQDQTIDVSINNIPISKTKSYKYLGVTMDPTLNFQQHFQNSYKKASARVRLLQKIRSSLNVHSAESIYRSMITPIVLYCNSVLLSYCSTKMQKIQRLESRCKNIISSSKNVCINVQSIDKMISKRTCIMVYDCLKGHGCDLFENYFDVLNNRNTRNRNCLIKLPKVKTEMGKRGFYFKGAKIYNDLPLYIRAVEGRSSFINKLNDIF